MALTLCFRGKCLLPIPDVSFYVEGASQAVIFFCLFLYLPHISHVTDRWVWKEKLSGFLLEVSLPTEEQKTKWNITKNQKILCSTPPVSGSELVLVSQLHLGVNRGDFIYQPCSILTLSHFPIGSDLKW